MRLRIRLALFALAVVSPAVPAAPTLQGVALPDAVHVPDWDAYLRHAGAAIVYRRYLPFQVVALYVERGAIDPTALQRAMTPCRIEVHWLTPLVAPDEARDYWKQQIDAAIGDPLMRARLEQQTQRVADALSAGGRGQVSVIDYHPDRGLSITGPGGARTRFAGLELTRAVLSIWLGPDAPKDVRDALLTGTTAQPPPKPPATR